MELLGYFLYKKRLFLYLFLSLLLALPFLCFTEPGRIPQLFVLILLELFLLRLVDDWTDYETDREAGKMQVKKDRLRTLIFLFTALYLGLNLLFFGLYGFLGIFLLVLIFFKEACRFLPPAIGFLSGLFYLSMTVPIREIGWEESLFLFILLFVSVIYGIRKRKKDDF